jgi:hypothetical protein
MLGQATPSSSRSWISVDTAWEVSTRHPDDVATRPDATQRSRIFQVSFTDTERSDSEDRPDTRPSRPDTVLLWKESRYSGKAVGEDLPDEANFRSDSNSPEFDFEQN